MEPRLCWRHPSTVQGLSGGSPAPVGALTLPILEIREKATKECQETHSSLNCGDQRAKIGQISLPLTVRNSRGELTDVIPGPWDELSARPSDICVPACLSLTSVFLCQLVLVLKEVAHKSQRTEGLAGRAWPQGTALEEGPQGASGPARRRPSPSSTGSMSPARASCLTVSTLLWTPLCSDPALQEHLTRLTWVFHLMWEGMVREGWEMLPKRYQ